MALEFTPGKTAKNTLVSGRMVYSMAKELRNYPKPTGLRPYSMASGTKGYPTVMECASTPTGVCTKACGWMGSHMVTVKRR